MTTEKAKSRFATTGGILVIIAACIGVFDGLVALADSISWLSVSSRGAFFSVFVSFPQEILKHERLLGIGLFAIIASIFGFAAGIQSLKGKKSSFIVVGICLLAFVGFLNLVWVEAPFGDVTVETSQISHEQTIRIITSWNIFPASTSLSIFGGKVFGGLILLLSLLGLAFVTAKKQEFT